MTDPSKNAIEHVRVIQKEQQTEVLVEGKGQLSCTPFRLSRPDRLVLDFSRATLRALPPAIPMGAHPLRAIRVGQFKADVARVVIELDGQAPYLFTAKENFVTVVFGSPAAAIPAVAAKEEKKSSPVSASVPVKPASPPSPNPTQRKAEARSSEGFSTKPAPVLTSSTAKDEKKPIVVGPFASAAPTTPPSSAQAQSKTEAKSSLGFSPAPAPVLASPAVKDEKKPAAGGTFASAIPAPSSSVQPQSKTSTPSPAGLQPTPEQSRSSVAPSSSLPQPSESSSARSVSLPPHAAGSPVSATSDEKKSYPVSASALPTSAPTPPLDPALIEGRSSLGLPAPPATVPPSSPAASAASSSTPSSVELSPTRAGSPSAAPSSSLPQPSEKTIKSTSFAQNDAYVLGPLDVIAINVWRDPELSRIEPVRPDGKISLPLIGDMQASGLTPKMLQVQVTKALEDYVRKPEVTVILQEANSHRFNLIGEVARPGSYLLATNMTVLDALAAAGGFRDFAKAKKIYVLRKMPNGSSQRIPFNYKQAIKGSRDMNLQLLPGDTIVVP